MTGFEGLGRANDGLIPIRQPEPLAVARPIPNKGELKGVLKMKGARPLTNEEIILVSGKFDGTFEARNRSLFMLGVSVGGRISELLSLTIGDVYQNHQPVSDLLFQKAVVKGKENARMVPVNADGRKAIISLFLWHERRYGDLSPGRPLFPSRNGGGFTAMTRKTGHEVLKAAFEKAGLNGKLATHSLRKSYAQRMYDASGDIFLVREMLGHADVRTTQKYLGVSYQKAQRVSEAIETSSRKVQTSEGLYLLQGNRTGLLLRSVSELETDKLVMELQLRGFDATAIIHQMQSQKPKVVVAGEKVIPINALRRATGR